ncbi:MAG: ferredoxin family protein [Chloroflexi bacterium]|nr:ferredoxin family protein [Chloroflexota bacterium]
MPPVVSEDGCTACGICVDICSEDVFAELTEGDRVARAKRPDECWHCGACVIDCPTQAIKLYIPLPMRL